MKNTRTPRLVLLTALALGLCPSAQAQFLPFDGALAGHNAPGKDYLSPGFIGPRTPDQQREFDAAQAAAAQGALGTVSDPCVPWRIPCKLPDDAKIGKNDGFIDPPAGETWVKTPDGWTRCTSSSCDTKTLSCAENPGIAPCKAEDERKKKEATEKAFQEANARMFKNDPNKGNKTQNDQGGVAANGPGTTPKGAPASVTDGPGFSMLSSDAPGGDVPTDSDGHAVDKNTGNLLGKAIANDVLNNQPDNSLLSSNSLGAGSNPGGTAAGDWSGVDNAVGALSNVTDNGNSVSVGSPGGSRRGTDPNSAIGAMDGMSKTASVTGSSDRSVWQDVVSWAQKFDFMGTSSNNDPAVINPTYRNSPTFGRKVDSRGAPQD